MNYGNTQFLHHARFYYATENLNTAAALKSYKADMPIWFPQTMPVSVSKILPDTQESHQV